MTNEQHTAPCRLTRMMDNFNEQTLLQRAAAVGLSLRVEKDDFPHSTCSPREGDTLSMLSCTGRLEGMGGQDWIEEPYKSPDIYLVGEEVTIHVYGEPVKAFMHTTSDRASCLGCTREYIADQFPEVKYEDWLLKSMHVELREYIAWLDGDVWSYFVEDTENGEVIEDCHGFVGEDIAQVEGSEWLQHCVKAREKIARAVRASPLPKGYVEGFGHAESPHGWTITDKNGERLIDVRGDHPEMARKVRDMVRWHYFEEESI